MGQKVNPTGFRLGVIEGWQSRWYATRTYKDLLAEDRLIRGAIQKRLANASIPRIEIDRIAGANLSITIHTAKPGIVIGKNGESVERLRQEMEKLTKKKVRLNILEIRNPEANATLVARSIAEQLEKRVAFRRAMKQAVQKTMRTNAKGIKVIAGGRLGGAEIARTEKEVEGSVPLQTLRANIDYGFAEAHTTFGVIGVKVWIYHGDVLPEKQRAQGLETSEASPAAMAERGDRGQRGDRDRGPRPGGDRDRGPRSDRGGDRGGDRGPRPGGDRDRGPRPGGDRGPRPGGDRGPRPGGDRGPRPANASGLASRPPALARNAGSRTNVRSAEQSVAQSGGATPALGATPPATPSPTAPTVAPETTQQTPQATQAQAPTPQPTPQPEQANQPSQPNPTPESGSTESES